MDVDLGLNFAAASAAPASRHAAGKKGGKWTQRSNTKQKERRLSHKQPLPPAVVAVAAPATASNTKTTSQPASTKPQSERTSDSAKKSKDVELLNAGPPDATSSSAAQPGRKSFISSLFTSMPDMPAPAPLQEHEAGLPSNAPSDGSFASLGLYPELISCLRSTKFDLERPTPVQAAAVPALAQAKAATDFVVQAQTGSGKTLAYLLPVVQDLLQLGEQLAKAGHPPTRDLGTMAIVLVPTRELANQVYQVALNLLSMASSTKGKEKASDEEQEDAEPAAVKSIRPYTWITPGLLSGGMSRQHEKARLRKGVPLLIATPGRLIDHLETTTSFHIAGDFRKPQRPNRPKRKPQDSDDDFDIEDKPFEPGQDQESSEEEFTEHARSYKPRQRFGEAPAKPAPAQQPSDPRLTLRWLVLDEADRLVDMGFEPQVKKILAKLEERSAFGRKPQVVKQKRRTVLCSATMQANVKKLAGQVLNAPVTLRGDPAAEAQAAIQHKAPEQLAQSYAVIPPKLRLVALVALLRHVCVTLPKLKASSAKAVVFMSCTDAVDFHWKAFGAMQLGQEEAEAEKQEKGALAQRCPVLSNVPIYRLHGSLDLQTRLGSLKAFTSSKEGGILLCTSLAARGLDVPFVNSVIQYDLPTEGGLTEYVHRVGRTARAGQEGSSWAFLLPPEVAWVDWAKKETGAQLREAGVQDLLRDGFGGRGKEFESRATDVQLAVERWVEAKPTHADLARDAFTSHVRAYATHPSNEKHIFHRRNLHLGHMAKAFGLREAPSGLGRISGSQMKERSGGKPTGGVQRASAASGQQSKKRSRQSAADLIVDDVGDASEAEEDAADQPSKPKLPRTGRGAEGRGLRPHRAGQAAEFNLGSTADLEALVRRAR